MMFFVLRPMPTFLKYLHMAMTVWQRLRQAMSVPNTFYTTRLYSPDAESKKLNNDICFPKHAAFKMLYLIKCRKRTMFQGKNGTWPGTELSERLGKDRGYG